MAVDDEVCKDFIGGEQEWNLNVITVVFLILMLAAAHAMKWICGMLVRLKAENRKIKKNYKIMLNGWQNRKTEKETRMSSIKVWLKKIERQNKVSKEDLEKIMEMLDGHDDVVRKEERNKTLSEVESAMYHECFEFDHDADGLQKWDSGNWLRYKLFENVIDKMKGETNGRDL